MPNLPTGIWQTFVSTERLQPSKIHGELSARGLRIGIVASRFNSFITDRLLTAAVDALERSGAQSADVDVVHVPGSFELPVTAKKMAQTGKYDALIAIGCVIRGETSHYDYVCAETRGSAISANGYRSACDILCSHRGLPGTSHRPRRPQEWQ